MTKGKIFLIVLVSIFVFFLVYIPHYNYPFPRHTDEWHHITEAIRLQEGKYSGEATGYEFGFHILLLLLSKITDLVLIYQFLPAIWAVFSVLVLFYLVYKKTDRQFLIALFAMIFFASIKSNVNITGLWFFTPLTFSLPFIFLYVYFFTEGIEKKNKKFILVSLAIMVMLLFVHSISVLFAISFLSIYALFNFKYIKKEWKFFSIFLIIPIVGALFYKFMIKSSWQLLIKNLIDELQFNYNWYGLEGAEFNNSFFELYSLIGYVLVIIGLVFIFKSKESLKKYSAYLLWPVTVLILIVIYRKTGVSYLSSHQRNLYYFAISLPMLSAFGLDYLLKLTKKPLNMDFIKASKVEGDEEIFKKTALFIIFITIIFFTFISYTKIPKPIDLYQVIDNDDYQALLFLSTLPKSAVVMATPEISTALYPISQHEPIATAYFYGDRTDSDKFFRAIDCQTKEQILNKYQVKYVLSESKIDCGWDLIYDRRDYIYEVTKIYGEQRK